MKNLKEIKNLEMVQFRDQVEIINVEFVDEEDELLQLRLRELDRAQARIREEVIRRKKRKSVRRMKIVGSILIGVIVMILVVIFYQVFE